MSDMQGSQAGEVCQGGCVVLDTNIWIGNPSLNTPIGVALIFALRKVNRSIGLPEVIEREFKKHTIRLALEAIDAVSKGYNMIGTIMGSRDDFRVPTEAEVEERIESLLKGHQSILTRIPFTLEHAHGALDRVLSDLPPNGPKNQQFKDSAIWEAILELSRSMDVDLVTADKQFFENRDLTKGLAQNLRRESEVQLHKIRIFQSLQSYLASLREEVPVFNSQPALSKILEIVMPALIAHAASKQFELGEKVQESVEAFITERSSHLALSYKMIFKAYDGTEVIGQESNSDVLAVSGSAFYNHITGELADLKPDVILYKRATGEIVGPNSVQYLSGMGFIGRRSVPTHIRVPINLESL
jgi:hypothetical protein